MKPNLPLPPHIQAKLDEQRNLKAMAWMVFVCLGRIKGEPPEDAVVEADYLAAKFSERFLK